MNVLVYHAHDREGQLLADLCLRLSAAGSMQYLPLQHPRSLLRAERFLADHGLNDRSPRPGLRPFLVSMSDTSGYKVHSHRVIHGSDLADWLHELLRDQIQNGAGGLQPIQESLMSHFSLATLSVVGLCLDTVSQDRLEPSPAVDQSPALPAGVGGFGRDAGAAPTPRASRAAHPHAIQGSGGTAASPSGPSVTTSRSLSRSGRDPNSDVLVISNGTANMTGSTESWTDAVIPEPKRDRMVNVADAMGLGKLREMPTNPLIGGGIRSR